MLKCPEVCDDYSRMFESLLANITDSYRPLSTTSFLRRASASCVLTVFVHGVVIAYAAPLSPKPSATGAPVATPTAVATMTPVCPSSQDLRLQKPKRPREAISLPGHGSRAGRDDYVHFGVNCHNAANAFARRDTVRNGIVLCNRGNIHKDEPNSPAGHTFNWRASEPDQCGNVEVCFYNWTQPCCYKTTTLRPGEGPDIEEYGAAMKCVKAFCGDQYEIGNPVAYPPGMLVEDAGWMACVKTAAGGVPNQPAGDLNFSPSAGKEQSCKKCCQEKAALVYDHWTPPFICGIGEAEKIMSQTRASLYECDNECEKYFRLSLPPKKIEPVKATPTATF